MMNKKHYKKAPDIVGDDDADTATLRALAMTAEGYIQSFSWCPPIKDMYFAYGVGGIVAVFIVEFLQKIQGHDEELWVVVGDVPSAYLVVEPMDDEAQALERYCELMDQWITAVRNADDLSKVFPVSAEPTVKHADMLRSRIELLRSALIPRIERRTERT